MHRGAGSHDQPAVRPPHRPRSDGAPHTREPAPWHHGGSEAPWRDAPLALAEPRRGLQSTPSRRRPRSSGDSSTGRKRARGAEAPPKPEQEPDGAPHPHTDAPWPGRGQTPSCRCHRTRGPAARLTGGRSGGSGKHAQLSGARQGLLRAVASPPGCPLRWPQARRGAAQTAAAEEGAWEGGIPGESPPAAWHLEAGGAPSRGCLSPSLQQEKRRYRFSVSCAPRLAPRRLAPRPLAPRPLAPRRLARALLCRGRLCSLPTPAGFLLFIRIPAGF